jgi:hypothetical protein
MGSESGLPHTFGRLKRVGLELTRQVLIVAAGGSYYYAKKDLKGRKLDPALREARLGQGGSSSSGNITCGSPPLNIKYPHVYAEADLL